MKVVCLRNRETPEGDPMEPGGGPRVTVGAEYLVYAVAWDSSGKTVYYLCDDLYSYYPFPHFGEWFSVTDGRLPSAWILAQSDFGARCAYGLYAAEWAGDRYFYDRVSDAEPAATGAWFGIKEQIDAEVASSP
ncbi:MAG TPA: hypothetical protein VGM37_05400 [Armatimonadota bacterium]|jgi:hypothetical protein